MRSARRLWWHGSRERHGYRGWLSSGPRELGVEVYWWTRYCHVSIESTDDGWTLSAACPPLAVWLHVDGFGLWQPMRPSWRGATFLLPDERTCRLAVRDWTLYVEPWARTNEWHAADPWWVRGVRCDLKDVALGRVRYTCEQVGEPFDVAVPMPEGTYRAVFQRQRETWRRPRWRTTVRDSFDIDVPKGIPFAGKGENGWDCDDDGLFGMSAEGTVEDAVAQVRASVMRSRAKYGRPSDASIRAALA